MGKYFTVEVKPTILPSIQDDGAFVDSELLFDWTSFDIPKGAARLINITALIRGNTATPQTYAMDLLFAKSRKGGSIDPPSLGTAHATANGTGYQNHLIGAYKIEESDYTVTGQLDNSVNISVTSQDMNVDNRAPAAPSLVLQGEPETGINVGYDRLWVGATTPDGGAIYNAPAVILRGAITDDSTVVAPTDAGSDDDPDAELKFAPGDIIYATDDLLVGTIKSIAAFDTNQQSITFESGITSDLADNDVFYNVHPITLILQFEK